MSSTPELWRRLALDPPRAHGTPPVTATLKATPEDFVVEEQLGFEADGGVAHLLLQVEKRGRDTLAVARELARHAGLAPRDVGFAGLKDRHAVATQWFTVPVQQPPTHWSGVAGDEYRVLAALPHSRKLRRGALSGNRFRLRLGDVTAPDTALAPRLAAIVTRGVPNYFGPQRFGYDGSNLEAIARWCAGEGLPRSREGRAFVLSAARSLLFNAVLAARVADGSWERLLPGEFVNLAGRNSYFVAQAIDETLIERLGRYDIHPTGPLAGRGRVPDDVAGALESTALAPFAEIAARLESADLEAARRPLRLVPAEFDSRVEAGSLHLRFALPPGAYATALVRELAITAGYLVEFDDA